LPPADTSIPAPAALPQADTSTPVPATLPPTTTPIPATPTVTPVPYDASSNPGVLPPDSIVQGKTYAEWINEWWKYGLSLPMSQSPISPGGTGVDCMLRRVGDVTLIVAHEYKGLPTRCEVPAGTMVFLEIMSVECSTLEGDGKDEEGLRTCLQRYTYQELGATIDGVAVQNLDAFFVSATPLYQFTVPEDNILKASAGATGKSVANGVFLMLSPLSPGKHAVHTQVFLPLWNVKLEKTLAITVVESDLVGAEQATPASVSASGRPVATAALATTDLELQGVSDVQQVARLVGDGAINDTEGKWGVFGAGLGSMFDKDGKLYMLFGDTFGCCIPVSGGTSGAKDWRGNTMAIITDKTPQDGLTFDDMYTDRAGHAGYFLPLAIPTNGIAIGDRMVVHYMAVKNWGLPGVWEMYGSGLATSDDDGQTWVKDAYVTWPADANFGQVAFVKSGEYRYLFGIPGGRFGGVKLARVPQEQVLDPSRYEYFAGLDGDQPLWAVDEKSGALVVPAPAGELSVMWDAYLQRWIMTYLDDDADQLVIREAQELWGPWGPALTLVSGKDYPGLYGAYLHPWYVENDGETIYFTMSQWGPYTVYLMKAHLDRK
jgi:hypothetical protein